jgi:hypothetical protein
VDDTQFAIAFCCATSKCFLSGRCIVLHVSNMWAEFSMKRHTGGFVTVCKESLTLKENGTDSSGEDHGQLFHNPIKRRVADKARIVSNGLDRNANGSPVEATLHKARH